MKVLDLFAGCGGMSEGFRQAGYDIAGFVEFWKPAADTFRANFDTAFQGEDITRIPDSDAEKLRGRIDVVIGGPPCQGFSTAGKRDPSDPRNSLFMEFVRFVRIIRPRAFVMENVPGLYSMATAAGESVFNLIVREFNGIGYGVAAKLMCADNYGVPQRRRRVVFVGTPGGEGAGLAPAFPEARLPKVSVGEVIGDLPYGYVKETQHVGRKRMARRSIIELREGQKITSFGAAGIKLRWDRPACTITRGGMYGHPRYDRYLTIREVARLQSFPDPFRFCGGLQDMYMMIGNAVPPLMARAVAEKLKSVLGKSAV